MANDYSVAAFSFFLCGRSPRRVQLGKVLEQEQAESSTKKPLHCSESDLVIIIMFVQSFVSLFVCAFIRMCLFVCLFVQNVFCLSAVIWL